MTDSGMGLFFFVYNESALESEIGRALWTVKDALT